MSKKGSRVQDITYDDTLAVELRDVVNSSKDVKKSFKVEEMIGSGEHSIVFRGVDKKGVPVCMKVEVCERICGG